jgi:lysophospholipase L1-like esterase
MQKRYRSAITKASLIIVSVVISLAIFEIVLRAVGYDPLKRLKNGREFILKASLIDDLRYELTPGASGYAWGTDVQINDNGHRGRSGVFGKFNGFRAVVVGDSITFGNFLPLESTYSYQLHEILNDKNPSKYEVLNLGVGGYDIVQEVANIEHFGLNYKPDLVVVGLCLNDIGISSPNLEYINNIDKYRSGVISYLRSAQFFSNAIDKILLVKWMKKMNKPEIFQKHYKTKIAPISKDEHLLYQLMKKAPDIHPLNWYKSEQHVGLLRYSFEHLSKLQKNENFKVVILIFPWLVEESGIYPYETAHKIVTHEANRVGFDIVEIVDEYLEAGVENLKITKKDLVHPNDLGHRIVAQKIADYIKENRH